jgi:hypothetical protein
MEKLIRYKFEQMVQDVTDTSKEWLANELQMILESNKAYQSKCDYIGYSILSIDEKVKLLDEQIKSLQEYKSKLKQSKEIVLTVGANVFQTNGINKIEGASISSITVTKQINSNKASIFIEDEDMLIQQGFYKKVIDEKAILNSYINNEYKELIESCATIKLDEVIKPSKLKVNKRRVVNNNQYSNTKDIAC